MNEPRNSSVFEEQTTAGLIAAARGGCREAQNQLLSNLQTYLAWVAERQLDVDLRRKLGASDAVQMTLLKAAEQFGGFRGSNAQQLHAWVHEILVNEVKQIRRTYGAQKRDIHREHGLAAESEYRKGEGSLADSFPTPGAQAIGREQADMLHRAVARLPVDYRQVIQFRNWDRLSFQEIGQRMNRTENAVTKLWFRALVRLEQEMEATDERPE